MIEIKNLWKTFGDKSVLKGIDLKIEKGKVFAYNLMDNLPI